MCAQLAALAVVEDALSVRRNAEYPQRKLKPKGLGELLDIAIAENWINDGTFPPESTFGGRSTHESSRCKKLRMSWAGCKEMGFRG
jgi:hypothetical protein